MGRQPSMDAKPESIKRRHRRRKGERDRQGNAKGPSLPTVHRVLYSGLQNTGGGYRRVSIAAEY